MDPKLDKKLSTETSGDQAMPYKGFEVQLLMQQVIILNEVIESTAAAQCCQVLWVCIGYDGLQDLVREVKEIEDHYCHSFLSLCW